MDIIYIFLVIIGLTTLVISLIVFFNTTKPFSLPYIFFLLISLAFFAFFVFSPTGELDLMDSLFFWLDKIAFLCFPPLLLHYFFLFPKRKRIIKTNPNTIYYLYLPSVLLLAVNGFLHLPNVLDLNDSLIQKLYQTSEKMGLLLFTFFSIVTLVIIFFDSRKATAPLIKRQLKWIMTGLGVGIIPFAVFYTIPYLVGLAPSKAAEFTVVLQALFPLTFAYTISRFKFMDLELLLKKSIPLILSYVFVAIVYFIVTSQFETFEGNRVNVLFFGILALILGATVFSPLKKFLQSLIDRVIYKRSYKYRRTLLSISQELSREKNLQKLSQSILELIANALSLKTIALLLPGDESINSFSILEAKGEFPSLPKPLSFDSEIYTHLNKNEFISVYSFSEKRELQKKFRSITEYGFFHLMPLRVEAKLIGCLGMGKKVDNTFLTSEDWELLRTISSPVALALENAYLYNQANLRAVELERLKDYSENIIESLTVGVAVLDTNGKIIGWNRILEDTFARAKDKVIGSSLMDILGKKNFLSIFPPDTQQDYRLLSEITIEMPKKGGKKVFDIIKTPLLDNRMNPYGTIIVFEDITEKISMQQQLLTSEKLASIGLLSAGVAHEINTPLTGISSYLQILQKKLSDSSHSQILEKIEAQTERVARIVKNLLNFARSPADSTLYLVNLHETLQTIISLIDYKLKNMNIRLNLDLLPIDPVWAHGERLQQVFINIILNAIDAMPDGGILTIGLFQVGKQAVIKIEDTGTGIKDQHLPHIFDPFFTTKGIEKGTGLGLSISYAIIKEHEGRIKVESEVGKGSQFTIFIPMDLDKKKSDKSSIASNR